MAEGAAGDENAAALESDAMASTYRWTPGQVVGNYVVERPIAHGGMGEVYRARHRWLDRLVAIKTIREALAQRLELVGRFMREAQVLARIEHENVVRVFDFGEHEGTYYMTMEWLQGETLDARRDRPVALREDELAGLLVQACAGIAAAHELGVVHRDLKPENIFLTPGAEGEVVKVVDFGIASAGIVGPDGVDTATRTVIGTPDYMSPEQWGGVKNLTAASDQFSLGVIAYVCATGELPFTVEDDKNFAARAVKTQLGRYAPMRSLRPELSPEFEAVVARALKPAMQERYESMRELGQALLPLADARTRERYARPFGVGAWSLPPIAAATIDEAADTVPDESPPPRATTLGGSISVLDTPAPRERRPKRSVVTVVAALGLTAMLTVGIWVALRPSAQHEHATAQAGDAAVRPTPVTTVPLSEPTTAAQPASPLALPTAQAVLTATPAEVRPTRASHGARTSATPPRHEGRRREREQGSVRAPSEALTVPPVERRSAAPVVIAPAAGTAAQPQDPFRNM